MKLLVNAIHAKAGGGVTYLLNLLPQLEGFDIHVLLSPRQAALEPLAACATLHRTPMPEGFFALMLWEQFRVPAIFRRLGADILLSPANYGPLAVRRQVLVMQNELSVGRLDRRLRRRLYWRTLATMTRLSRTAAAGAIAVSSFIAEQTGGTVIPHGVAPIFSPDPAAVRQDFVLAVSDLYVQKNLETLFAAGLPARILVAGGDVDPEYAAALRRKAPPNVTFLGRVSPAELVSLYRHCAVFVFPSMIESFGMPVLEAMACGAPVAVARAAAMPEIAGDAALYFDPADPADLRRTVQRLLDDPALRADLGAKAAARARGFTWEKTAARTAEVLRRCAA
jgi:glycosyltransferase involved in cell wall biosynthesis